MSLHEQSGIYHNSEKINPGFHAIATIDVCYENEIWHGVVDGKICVLLENFLASTRMSISTRESRKLANAFTQITSYHYTAAKDRTIVKIVGAVYPASDASAKAVSDDVNSK